MSSLAPLLLPADKADWALAGGDADKPAPRGALVGQRVSAVMRNFCTPLPASNPRLLAMFAQRDARPYRGLLAWSGEFVGKYLTHCAQLLEIREDRALRDVVASVVAELATYQDPATGYIGPFPSQHEFDPAPPSPLPQQPWDAWGHYHVLYGLLRWHRCSGDAGALAFARRIGECLVARFGRDPKQLYACAAYEQNSAIVHAAACLYEETQDPALLQLCQVVLLEFQMPPCGDYVRVALAGTPFYKGPQPRWEGLISVLGVCSMAWLTGQRDYATAYENIWWSLCQLERHNNGGLMSGEQARGNPYNQGSVETCCTVTWGAMCVEMLKLTGLSLAADELEMSLYNSGLFLLSPSGRWCVYNSPMGGVRESTTMEIAFQARAAASELSCCSVNGPRILGLLSDYAVMTGPATGPPAVFVNAYLPCTVTLPVGAAGSLTLAQATEYPLEGKVTLTVTPAAAGEFTVHLRIPSWSARTTVSVDGQPVAAVTPGAYLPLTRAWPAAPVQVEVEFDFRLRGWKLGQDVSPDGRASARGPGRTPESVPRAPVDPPTPTWDSVADGKWPASGRLFHATGGELVVVDAHAAALDNGPSTMMGWVCIPLQFVGDDAPGIPFSCGAGAAATPNMARAVDLFQSNISYFNGGSDHDVVDIVDSAAVSVWTAAVHSQAWQHVAFTDDGARVTAYLNGRVVGSAPHKDASRKTQVRLRSVLAR